MLRMLYESPPLPLSHVSSGSKTLFSVVFMKHFIIKINLVQAQNGTLALWGELVLQIVKILDEASASCCLSLATTLLTYNLPAWTL